MNIVINEIPLGTWKPCVLPVLTIEEIIYYNYIKERKIYVSI